MLSIFYQLSTRFLKRFFFYIISSRIFLFVNLKNGFHISVLSNAAVHVANEVKISLSTLKCWFNEFKVFWTPFNERWNGRPMNRIWIKVANYPKALLCVQKQWHDHLHRLKCVILKANFGGSPTSYRINELIQWKISLSKLHAENGASEKVKSYKEWITTKQKQEGSNRIAESDSDWPQANINPNRKWCGT